MWLQQTVVGCTPQLKVVAYVVTEGVTNVLHKKPENKYRKCSKYA